MANSGSSIIEKAIQSLTMNNKCHICIHDTSGILYTNPLLEIPAINRIHSGCFCHNAKTTAAGMRFCLRCKAATLKKALTARSTFMGQCYLGISEIVRPVILHGKVACVIYIGNFLIREQTEAVKSKIERICKTTEVSSSLLINSLDSLQWVSENELAIYSNAADLLEYLILSGCSNTKRWAEKPETYSPIYRNTRHWVIESIQNYVSEFYNKELKLSYLSKLYYMNTQYLCRLFRKETGMNFSDFINHIRIEQAQEMLHYTEDTIVNIALKVGFNSVTYFNRLFKKATGMSPCEYRQRVQI